jgi:hypothetical protein
MNKLVYVAPNPVKDRLVDKVHHWPGVNGLAALLGGHVLHATRSRHFVRPQGPMPAAVTLRLTLPSELLAAYRDARAGASATPSRSPSVRIGSGEYSIRV